MPRFIDAERAFRDGDLEPNLAPWSTEDPVMLFAAWGLNLLRQVEEDREAL